MGFFSCFLSYRLVACCEHPFFSERYVTLFSRAFDPLIFRRLALPKPIYNAFPLFLRK